MDDGFVAQHRSSSRPWLLCCPGWQQVDRRTTTQTVFTPPKFDNIRSKGPRREVLESFFWQHQSKEVVKHLIDPQPVEPYITEYDGHFNLPDFKPAMETIPEQSELHQTYPLYSNAPFSYWKQKTPSAPADSFKRYTAFSKPVYELLDEPPEGLF